MLAIEVSQRVFLARPLRARSRHALHRSARKIARSSIRKIARSSISILLLVRVLIVLALLCVTHGLQPASHMRGCGRDADEDAPGEEAHRHRRHQNRRLGGVDVAACKVLADGCTDEGWCVCYTD